MPLYEYRCHRCGQTFELIQKFSDEPLTTHEGCGGAVDKLLSSPALQFKGSGWYITDYARSGSKAGNGSSTEKNGKSTSGESSSSSTESKPSTSSSTSTSESK